MKTRCSAGFSWWSDPRTEFVSTWGTPTHLSTNCSSSCPLERVFSWCHVEAVFSRSEWGWYVLWLYIYIYVYPWYCIGCPQEKYTSMYKYGTAWTFHALNRKWRLMAESVGSSWEANGTIFKTVGPRKHSKGQFSMFNQQSPKCNLHHHYRVLTCMSDLAKESIESNTSARQVLKLLCKFLYFRIHALKGL